MSKVITTVCLNPKLKERASELGINISGLLEEALQNKLFEFQEHNEAELENNINLIKAEINKLNTNHEKCLINLTKRLKLLKKQLEIVHKERESVNEEVFNQTVKEFKNNILKRLKNGLDTNLTLNQKRVWQSILARKTNKQVSLEYIDQLIKEVINQKDNLNC